MVQGVGESCMSFATVFYAHLQSRECNTCNALHAVEYATLIRNTLRATCKLQQAMYIANKREPCEKFISTQGNKDQYRLWAIEKWSNITPDLTSREHMAATPQDACNYLRQQGHRRLYEILHAPTCATHFYLDFEASVEQAPAHMDTTRVLSMLANRVTEFFESRKLQVQRDGVVGLNGDRVTKHSGHLMVPLQHDAFQSPLVVRKVLQHFLHVLQSKHPSDFRLLQSADGARCFVDLQPYTAAQQWRTVFSCKLGDETQTPLMPSTIFIADEMHIDWDAMTFDEVFMMCLAGVTRETCNARYTIIEDWDGPSFGMLRFTML